MADGTPGSSTGSPTSSPASSPVPRVRVVVVHYGDPELTSRCLASVKATEWPADRLDVVVVDNDPAPLDASSVPTGARLVRAGHNLGFAGGANLGIAHLGEFDFVALLNNDAVASPGWLRPLVEALTEDVTLGAACPKIVLDDLAGVINSAGLCLVEHGFAADRGYLERDDGQYDVPADVFGWCGGAVLLRKDYLTDAGALDERLFAYYEDADLSWRGRLLGWRYRYMPASVVHHRHAASLGVSSERFRFLDARNRLLVLAKLAPPLMAVRAFAVEVKLLAVEGPGSWRRHLRILGSACRWLPAMLADRARLRRRRVVTDQEVLAWIVPRAASGDEGGQ